MNSSALWLLCLLGIALLNQGRCRPSENEYLQDGEVEDYDDEDEYTEESGPPPTIKSTPMVLEVRVNEIAVFPCEVEGNSNLYSRVWRKDSKEGLFLGSVKQTNDPRINNLENGSLEITDVQPSDAGLYSCMISVQGKSPEVVHTLKVKRPATITRITPNERLVAIKQTATLTLECIAEGHPTPSIKWFRNGHVLEDMDPSIHGARYTIDNASAEDSGIYKCTATNGQQMPDEKTIEVQVHYPPQIKIAREIVPTGEGYESELRCTVTGMNKPEVKWYKTGDQRQIISTQNIKVDRNGHDHILRILKTQESDFGDYVCEAKNNEGQNSAVIRLTGKPSRPEAKTISNEEDTKNPVLTYKVESFAPILDYELLYKKQEKDEWISVKPAVIPSTEGRFFTVKHTLTGLEPGVYVAQIKAKNNHGWSEFSSLQTFAREHDDDLRETGLLAIEERSDSHGEELRISVALIVSLLVARFFC